MEESAGIVIFEVENMTPEMERDVIVQFYTSDGSASGIYPSTTFINSIIQLYVQLSFHTMLTRWKRLYWRPKFLLTYTDIFCCRDQEVRHCPSNG